MTSAESNQRLLCVTARRKSLQQAANFVGHNILLHIQKIFCTDTRALPEIRWSFDALEHISTQCIRSKVKGALHDTIGWTTNPVISMDPTDRNQTKLSRAPTSRTDFSLHWCYYKLKYWFDMSVINLMVVESAGILLIASMTRRWHTQHSVSLTNQSHVGCQVWFVKSKTMNLP